MPLSKRKKGQQHVEALPAGVVNRVQLSPYRVVLAGVQTCARRLSTVDARKSQAVGYVEFNERGQRTVAARIAGRIDKLFVNETGQMVDEGDDWPRSTAPIWWSPSTTCWTPNGPESQRNLDSARSRLNCWESATIRSTRFCRAARPIPI